jgi:hypothetical protein
MSLPAPEDALHLAAEIFLRGPVHTEPSGPGRIDIAEATVQRIARTLASCRPSSIGQIENAVTCFRQDPSWHTRAAVIEAVTLAAAAVPAAREETP